MKRKFLHTRKAETTERTASPAAAVTAVQEQQTATGDRAGAAGVMPIQCKLSVGAVNDPMEQEADSMADRVMGMDTSFIQKKGDDGDGMASEGLTSQINNTKGSGAGMNNSARSFMENRFGADFSGVNIHTGDYAVQMNRELNAQAFTVGNDIYFNEGRYDPDTDNGRHLLAHELTHTMQQQGGTVQKKIQRYTLATGDERIADDGKMVVEDHTKNAWTEPAKIDASNKILSDIKSEISLRKLGTKRKQKVPGGTAEFELEKYDVVMKSGGSAGDLKRNCGRACLQVLGHNVDGDREFVGVTKNKKTSEYTPTEKYHGDDQAPGGATSTTEELSAHIYIMIMEREFKKTLSREDALKEWKGLTETKRQELSKKYGINEFAIPQVGQGITMGTEFDSPGFKDDRALGRSNDTWNFHFGSPVVTSGSDYTTVENFTGSSHNYYFSMFGPTSKKQSWYDEQKTAGFGSDFTAMVVQHPSTLLGHVNEGSTLLVKSPEDFVSANTGVLASLADGTKGLIQRKGVSWMKITVMDGKHAGKVGWIMNKYFSQ